LRRLGCIKKRHAPRLTWNMDARPRVLAKAPNDVWTIDFKGWWLAGKLALALAARKTMAAMNGCIAIPVSCS